MNPSFKLETDLEYFKFNSILNTTGYRLTWFILEENEENTRGFSNSELNTFIDFTNLNKENFSNKKNYHVVNDDDCPYIDFYSSINGEDAIDFPNKIFLKQNPKLIHGEIYENMDIILTSKNGIEKEYNLPFNVLGVFR